MVQPSFQTALSAAQQSRWKGAPRFNRSVSTSGRSFSGPSIRLSHFPKRLRLKLPPDTDAEAAVSAKQTQVLMVRPKAGVAIETRSSHGVPAGWSATYRVQVWIAERSHTRGSWNRRRPIKPSRGMSRLVPHPIAELSKQVSSCFLWRSDFDAQSPRTAIASFNC